MAVAQQTPVVPLFARLPHLRGLHEPHLIQDNFARLGISKEQQLRNKQIRDADDTIKFARDRRQITNATDRSHAKWVKGRLHDKLTTRRPEDESASKIQASYRGREERRALTKALAEDEDALIAVCGEKVEAPAAQLLYIRELTRLEHTSFEDGGIKLYYVHGVTRAEKIACTSLDDFVKDPTQFEGKGALRLARIELADGRWISTLGENESAYRKTSLRFADGQTQFYEGAKGVERLVRTRYSDGKVKRYEGDRGAERLMCVELPEQPTSAVQRLQQCILQQRQKQHIGVQGYEEEVAREVVEERPVHRRHFYEGPKGEEKHVRSEHADDGRILHYNGETSALESTELPDGRKRFFKGVKGAERLVRTEFAAAAAVAEGGGSSTRSPLNTTTTTSSSASSPPPSFALGRFLYKGAQDAEHVIAAEFAGGAARYYEGSKGLETLKQYRLADGSVRTFAGEPGEERILNVSRAVVAPADAVTLFPREHNLELNAAVAAEVRRPFYGGGGITYLREGEQPIVVEEKVIDNSRTRMSIEERATANLDLDEGPDAAPVSVQLAEALQRNSAKVVDLFRQWDNDGDRNISRTEFHKAMKHLGYQVPKVHIDELFDEFDEDGGGQIGFKELHKTLNRRPRSAASLKSRYKEETTSSTQKRHAAISRWQGAGKTVNAANKLEKLGILMMGAKAAGRTSSSNLLALAAGALQAKAE